MLSTGIEYNAGGAWTIDNRRPKLPLVGEQRSTSAPNVNHIVNLDVPSVDDFRQNFQTTITIPGNVSYCIQLYACAKVFNFAHTLIHWCKISNMASKNMVSR